jgi:hypothetical protein
LSIIMSDDQCDGAAAPTSSAQVIEVARTVASQALISTAQVVEIAREVIRQHAPEELRVFDAVAASWTAGQAKRRRGRIPSGAVGSGVEVLMLAEIVFPLITNALGQVLGTLAVERVRRPRRPKARSEAAAAAPGGKTPTSPVHGASGHDVHLSKQQAEAFRAACRSDAIAFGLAPSEADLLADACFGALISAGLS